MLERVGVTLVAVAMALPGCRGRDGQQPLAPTPTTVAREQRELSASDLKLLIAVKGRALRQLEEALAASSDEGGDALAQLKDLVVVEREAAAALGADWQRYTWVKEEIARLLALQRQGEDAKLLALELERSKQDLATQLSRCRDAASRQFLQAQIDSLEHQLEVLERGQVLDPRSAAELTLIESARVQLAELQGQQDRIQRRIRALVRQARGAAQENPTVRKLRDRGQAGGVGQEERK